MARRETLVQLSDQLVAELDAIAHRRSESRSQLIRAVLEDFVRTQDEAEKDRKLIEGYRRIPPGGVDEWGDIDAWHEWAERNTPLEPWEDE